MPGVLKSTVTASIVASVLPSAALAEPKGVTGTTMQPQVRYAASKTWVRQTVRGVLNVGTLEGVIRSADETLYYFGSKDPVASRLLNACGEPDELCEADVMLQGEEIIKVLSARTVRRSTLSDKEQAKWKQ